MGVDRITLAQLKPTQKGIITGYGNATGPLVQRLLQLGLLEGVEVEVVRRAPGGDPVEYRLLGYSLSLRRAEAANVIVDLLE